MSSSVPVHDDSGRCALLLGKRYKLYNLCCPSRVLADKQGSSLRTILTDWRCFEREKGGIRAENRGRPVRLMQGDLHVCVSCGGWSMVPSTACSVLHVQWYASIHISDPIQFHDQMSDLSRVE